MGLKLLGWMASARADLKSLPIEVQDEVGYELYQAQLGYFPEHGKSLKGLKGIIEIVVDFDKNAYRAVYAVKLGEKIYVLHVFQKKSKTGIRTPKEDLELIKHRLQTAKEIAKEEL